MLCKWCVKSGVFAMHVSNHNHDTDGFKHQTSAKRMFLMIHPNIPRPKRVDKAIKIASRWQSNDEQARPDVRHSAWFTDTPRPTCESQATGWKSSVQWQQVFYKHANKPLQKGCLLISPTIAHHCIKCRKHSPITSTNCAKIAPF